MPDIEVLVRRSDRPNGLPALLFVHGAYMGGWCWDEYFMPYFADAGFDCLALSLRGHGASAGSEMLDAAGIADYVEDVAYAARGLPVPPVVIGHSMGGIVAAHYAGSHGASAVVLLGTVPPSGLLSASVELSWRAPELYAQFALVQSGHRHLVDHQRLSAALFARDMPLDRAVDYLARMGRESQRVFAELAWPQICSVGVAADVPVAVVGGGQDGLFHADSAHAVARVHGVEAVLFPALGHAMMLDLGWIEAAGWIAGWLKSTLRAGRATTSERRSPAAKRERNESVRRR